MSSQFISRYNLIIVNRHIQIVVSNQSSVGGGQESPQFRKVSRVKFLIAGLLLAGVVAAALTIILVVGSILAAVAWIAFVLAIVGLILKTTFRRVFESDSSGTVERFRTR